MTVNHRNLVSAGRSADCKSKASSSTYLENLPLLGEQKLLGDMDVELPQETRESNQVGWCELC